MEAEGEIPTPTQDTAPAAGEVPPVIPPEATPPEDSLPSEVPPIEVSGIETQRSEFPPRAMPDSATTWGHDAATGGARTTTRPGSDAKPKGFLGRVWTGLLTFIAASWKFVYPILKLAKGGKILLTMGSMLLSVWFYSTMFGWEFALGFVVCIFVHEMGHVAAAWRLGKAVSAPIFIPGMGALILSKSYETAWEGAIIGIGGPLFGTFAALACWGYYGLSGNPLFLGLALTGFFLNLFNMIPMYPLDGGWITGAISPYIWVIGLVAMLALAIIGHVRNPFIFLLIIMSLPRIVNAFKTGTMDRNGERTSKSQRLTMGLAYVGLSAFLVWGVAATGQSARDFQESRDRAPSQVAMR